MMLRAGSLLASLGMLLAPALALESQERSRDQIPTFRAGTTSVLVDALVLDDDGDPVTGLTREDFQIYEDGVEQTIATFDVTDWTSYVAERTAPDPTPAGTTSRVNAYPRRFVFIVNRQGAKFEYLARAKRALQEFVVESMADGDEAMVLEIGHSSKVVQDFRATKEETLESIKTLSQMDVPYPMGAYRASSQVYEELQVLGRSLAELRGRKIVVFLSMELPTFAPPGSRESSEGRALKDAIESLNQANVSVYTIDLSGFEGLGSDYLGGLSPLATETGGRYFQNATTFERPLRRIGRENQRYYLLSYVPENPEADGSFRRIEVRVSRPDVEVIARRGYFAREREALATDAAERDERGEETARAKSAPSESGLPDAVIMTTYLLPTGTGTVRVPLSVALPSALVSGQGGDERTLTVTIARDGERLASFEQPVSAEQYYLSRHVDLEPGLYLMQTTLRSRERELYQASMGIEVPSGFGDRFGLSSIIPVVSPEAAGSVGDELPILPAPAVERGENAHVLFQIFPGKNQPSETAYLSFRIYGENGTAVHVRDKEDPVALAQSPTGGTPVLLSLPTQNLPPGAYRVEIRIEDPSLDRRATSEIELRIR